MSVSPGYRRYVLLILMGVYAFNFIDRQLLVILQESIKIELALSDTQLGLLTGFAFAMLYVTMGLPLARLADQSNRKNIVAFCLTLWSGITALTGMAANFTQLLLARIGVGIGEAGCSPQSHAIISDYYPVEKRATAISIYSLGIYAGIFIGYMGGGVINQYYGWRAAFYTMGIPGILLAVMLYFTVKEPLRGASDLVKKVSQDRSVWEVIRYLLSKKTFLFLSLGAGFIAFAQYGIGNWLPSFLFRYHGMQSQEVGIANALLIGIGGGLGTYLGGYLGDRFGRQIPGWYLWIPMLAALLALPLSLAAFFVSQKYVVLALFFPAVLLNSIYFAPSIAITHTLVPPNMRAVASSVLLFILNLIGLGGGPLATGTLSDWLRPSMGNESLRYAMGVIVFAGLIAGVLYYLAGQSVAKDQEGY